MLKRIISSNLIKNQWNSLNKLQGSDVYCNLNRQLASVSAQNSHEYNRNRYSYSNIALIGLSGAILWWKLQKDSEEFKVKAATINVNNSPSFDSSSPASTSEPKEGEESHKECNLMEPPKKKKEKNSFRKKRIIEYENRIRLYSNPEKIFRYFATIKYLDKDNNATIFMTPADFVRSLTPGVMQPRKYGLDHFRTVHHNEQFITPDKTMIFKWLEKDGLISYEDYLFLMTLLSTSPNDFRLAFSVYDVNGDGHLDKQEFERVQELCLKQSVVGQKHRDNFLPALLKKPASTSLTRHFFGKNQDQSITVEKFLQFQEDLHRDILRIEFERRDPESMPDGIISERSFAELLLIHAGLPDKKHKRIMKRVRKQYKKKDQNPGISDQECFAYFKFIYHIDQVDTALHFYKLAGKPLDKDLLKKVAKKIAKVELSDHVVDVVVCMFDENGDGMLSQNEFVAIMKKRMNRGIRQPKDTGVTKIFDALYTCGKRQMAYYMFQENRHLL